MKNTCENCINYNPISAEDGFCDKNGVVVEFCQVYTCHSNSNVCGAYKDYDKDGE